MREPILTLQVKNLSGASVFDPLFLKMTDFRKQSIYPAGVFGPASFTLPRNIIYRPTLLAAGFEVTVVDGVMEIYHGWVDSLEDISTGAGEGTRVECVGDWAKFMERRGIERRWADTDISQRWWQRDTTATAAELATDDRDNRIRITPKAEAWGNGDIYALEYTAPTGETIGRVENDYDMAESAGSNDWELRLRDTVGAADIWSVTTTSTGEEKNNLATPRQSLQLQFIARDAQTPTSDGTYYGEVSNVVVFSNKDHASRTLGSMNIYEIALDVVDLLGVDETSISADTSDLDSSLTLGLIPFVSNGYEMFGSQLARAAGYGTSSQEAIGFGLRPPSYAADGRPRLFVETYPALTDYDYEISTDDSSFSVRLNLDDVWNWIAVEYRDLEGEMQRVTPDDDSTLKDTASIAQYGQRETVLRIGDSDAATATDYGQRYLSRHKQPTYAVTRPLRVSRLRSKGGAWIHASRIDAGKRIRVVDLPNRIAQQSATGATFIITRADYDHTTQTANLSIGGVPDDLAIWLSQLELGG